MQMRLVGVLAAVILIMAATVLAVDSKAHEALLMKPLEELAKPERLPLFDPEVALLEAGSAPESSGSSGSSAGSAVGGISTIDALSSYMPEGGLFDNPATDTTLTRTIPESPSCTIRGQTVFEIRKLRQDARALGQAIMFEVNIMEKRKAYVEEMTEFLNDRIRELNKVKIDFAAEQKWIQVSNARVSELAQKEKLIKLQDVQSCIRSQQQRLQGDSFAKSDEYAHLNVQATQLHNIINAIQTRMRIITAAP